MTCQGCGFREALPDAPVCTECADVLRDVARESPETVLREMWFAMYPTVEALTS
jgi:hypothetical protein